MSEFIKTNGFLLVVYSNKNSNLFDVASSNVVNKYQSKRDKVAVVYDDFNTNMDVLNGIKKRFNGITAYNVAARRVTLQMDDKKFMAKRMRNSKFVPQHYDKIEDIPKDISKNQLFYVKKRGSSGANGVRIVKYSDIPREMVNESVIQCNNFNPDLYDDKRYKIRVYVLLHNGKVYINKKCWGSVASINYKEDISELTDDEIKKMNIIHQSPGRVWIKGDELENYEKIFENLICSCEDFTKIYEEEISKIGENEFSILGFDYVIGADKSVYIIEINHRSNYAHPERITREIDIPVLEDVMKLLVNQNIDDTEFKEVSKESILGKNEKVIDTVEEVKKKITNYKLIKMDGNEYYYVEQKKKYGNLYKVSEFQKYLDSEDNELPKEVGNLAERNGKHVFTPLSS